MKRCAHLLRCAMIAIGLFSCFGLSVHAQCISGGPPGWLTGKTPGGDGLIHASVNYSGGSTAPNSTVKGLAEDAVAGWNFYKCTTGVVLEETTGSGADLEFRYTTNENLTLGCAAYSTQSFTIWHGPNFQSRVNNMSAIQARAAFEHELGHFLGLDHTSFPSARTLMNQPSGTCGNAFINIPFVYVTDATKANTCMSLSSSPCAQPSPSPTPSEDEMCAETWWYWNFTNFSCYDQVQTCISNNYDQCYNVFGADTYPSDDCMYQGGCNNVNYFSSGGCCAPNQGSPVLIDLDGSGFHLTNIDNGIWFDFFGVGKRIRVAWTAPDSTNAWLVLDRDGDGVIESAKEMFGNLTAQPRSSYPNGFLALAEYDKVAKGGNGDGVVNKNDAIFNSLRLWQDTNHNGISEPSELHGLTKLKVESISLAYKESKRTDEYGNRFRYRAKVDDAKHAHAGRWAWDVILLTNKG